MLTELAARYDSRNSFYGKAQTYDRDGETILASYGTEVAKIDRQGNAVLLAQWNYSPTTLRHVKEFLRQNGFKAETKQQIASDYARNEP